MIGNAVTWIGKQLARLQVSHRGERAVAAPDPNPAPASGAPTQPPPATSVYAEALSQWSTAVKWLIAALVAVATAMIAGSQLASIGHLSATTERSRLLLAVGGIVLALVTVLWSIALLFWAQSPTNTDFVRLTKLARGRRSRGLPARVRRSVTEDATLNRGEPDLEALLRSLAAVRTDYYRLNTRYFDKAREVARQADDAVREAAQAERDRLENELSVLGERLTEYRTALLRVAQLDKFLRTRRRFRIASWTVLILSVPATFAFIAFVWAANPPAGRENAAPQRPVSGLLTLTRDGAKGLTQRLGADCAAAAAIRGIPVVALSSSDKGVEVVVVTSAKCPTPAHLTVTAGDGLVTATKPVLPASGVNDGSKPGAHTRSLARKGRQSSWPTPRAR